MQLKLKKFQIVKGEKTEKVSTTKKIIINQGFIQIATTRSNKISLQHGHEKKTRILLNLQQ